MNARDNAVSVIDKRGNSIPPDRAGTRPAPRLCPSDIPTWGQEFRIAAILFGIVGLLGLAAQR